MMIALIFVAGIASLLAVASLVKSSKLKRELEEHEAMLKKLRIENFQLVQTFQQNIDKFEDNWGDAR